MRMANAAGGNEALAGTIAREARRADIATREAQDMMVVEYMITQLLIHKLQVCGRGQIRRDAAAY